MSIMVNTKDGEEELLTLDDAARELGIGKTALHRYIRAGKLRNVRHGGRSYIPRSVVTAYWTRLRDEGATRDRRRRNSTRAS